MATKNWYSVDTSDKHLVGCLRLTNSQALKLKTLGAEINKLKDKKDALQHQREYLENHDVDLSKFISVVTFERKQTTIADNINLALISNLIPEIEWTEKNQKPKILLQKHARDIFNSKQSNAKKETSTVKENDSSTEEANNKKVQSLKHFIDLSDLFKVDSSIVAYTDGSFNVDEDNNIHLNGMIVINDNQKITSLSFELKDELVSKTLSKEYSPVTISELSAIDCALEFLKSKHKQDEEITLVVDSCTAIEKILNGLEEDDDNLLIQHIIKQLHDFSNLQFKWCKGHTKNLGNVIADKIIK